MIPPNSRRRFLFQSAVGVAGVTLLAPTGTARAVAALRTGPSRFRLGLAAYSFRQYMRHVSGEREGSVDPARYIDLQQFIDFAADQGCDGAELTAYYFPPNVTRGQLIELKRHAFLRGVTISGSAVGNTFTLPDGPELEKQIASVKEWIDRCQLMGAPHLRVFAGSPRGLSAEAAVRQCVKALKLCGDHAADRGVMLGIENHGGVVEQVEVLEQILNETNHDWVRVNLDTGNFYSATPYEDMERIAPYAVNVQFKVAINRRPGGRQPTDADRVFGILNKAGYQGFVTLEYEENEDPWQAVPRHLRLLRSKCSS